MSPNDGICENCLVVLFGLWGPASEPVKVLMPGLPAVFNPDVTLSPEEMCTRLK